LEGSHVAVSIRYDCDSHYVSRLRDSGLDAARYNISPGYFPSDYHGFSQNDNTIEPVLKVTEFWIGVGNRDYHYLSHFEIGGTKSICRQ
jgi:hypothetical protein